MLDALMFIAAFIATILILAGFIKLVEWLS